MTDPKEAGAPTALAKPRGRKPKAEKLSDEIRIVRELIHMTQAKADAGKPLNELLPVLETVSRACANLAALLKAEHSLEDDESAGDYVRAALEEIRTEMEENGIDTVLTSGLE